MRHIRNFKAWQIEAFQLGRPAKNYLIQSPGGAGKSLVQVMLAQADIEDTGNKQLLLVPKNHIHHGFYDRDSIEFVLPGQTRMSRWKVKSNFCATSKSDSKSQLLADFLMEDVRQLRREGSLAAIATHKALVEAWKLLDARQRRQAIRHLSIRVDESHHISNVFHDTDLDLFNRKDRQAIVDDATQLGKVIRRILQGDELSTKVHLATATFFRGDRRLILSEHFKRDFVHYYLPWDEHFETLGIQELTFNFLNYADDPLEAVFGMIHHEPKERHLIIIPALTHHYRTNKTLPKLLNGLKRIVPPNEILDLVTPELQEPHKQLLLTQPERFRVVVACRLFDEGTDWVPCTRMHNTDACEQSTTLAVQRIFRPLRPHPSKKVVRIFNYLPDLSPDLEIEEKRQILSNRFNAFLACIVTQGELIPNLVKVKSTTKEGRSARRSLQEVLGSDYVNVMEDLLKGYEAVENKGDSSQMERIAERVLDSYDFPEEVDERDLKDALLHQLVRIAHPKNNTLDRKKLLPQGVDAESIRQRGFDKVWEKISPVPSILFNGSENIDPTTIRELLSIVTDIPTLDEIHAGITSFHRRTGKRPTFHQSEWLNELGRSASAVDKILRRHFGTTLAKEVGTVLGSNNDLLTRTHELIREYWRRGIRIGNKFGYLPEIGMSSFALNGRLTWNFKTTLAKEVERLLGPVAKPLTLSKVRMVVRKYQKKGIRLHRKYGKIPELEMSSHNLADRLKRNFNVSLAELVEESN